MNFKNLFAFFKKLPANPTKPAAATLSIDDRLRILYTNLVLVMMLSVILVTYGVFLSAWLFTAGVILFTIGFWMVTLFAISNLQAILDKGIIAVLISYRKKS